MIVHENIKDIPTGNMTSRKIKLVSIPKTDSALEKKDSTKKL